MTLHNIFKCIHEADKDSNSGIKTCYLFDDVTEDCGDTIEEGDYGLNKYLNQPINCGNGGSLSEDKLTCNCNAGYFGRHCSDMATDCDDLRNRGITDRGEYSINLIPGQPPVTMTCHYGRTYVLYHSDTLYFTSFNRSWTEYRDGFSDNGNYWLGLKFLSYLTQEKNYNSIDFIAKVFNYGTEYMFTTYNGFNVRDASTQFLMTNGVEVVDSNPLGDILSALNSTPFSTYDNDNDNMSINCAMEYGGGWWYNKAGTYNRNGSSFQYDCAPANPTGYFADQCVTCNNSVKKINTGKVYGVKVQLIEAYISK